MGLELAFPLAEFANAWGFPYHDVHERENARDGRGRAMSMQIRPYCAARPIY